MYEPYESAAERARHFEAISNLAAEAHLTPDEVRPYYETAYLGLRPHARVKDYLDLFVARRTREALRQVTR